ncbi:MAG: hypothetical protein WDM89_20240 [Rhizomicrobium sp.]
MPLAHQHALIRRRPVHAPDFDGRIVVEPRGEIVLVQRIRRQRAHHGEIVDREAKRRLHLARGEAAGGFVGEAIERERHIVIGEALRHAIAAHDLPAPAQSGGAGGEMRLHSRWKSFHGHSQREISSRGHAEVAKIPCSSWPPLWRPSIRAVLH